ncbi:hypothetical protein MAPG_03382 [Magnaporthiopsis poae ATCC 64411]|uniref:Uncharacterized protein n=1 Tax=Magnaporthiopsis poae (strain ATCC 64411 / 73-15) TaxID=644358 RepID=A0A0C4DTV5_MAGP6|nr:hypothetical protein MAPG_03382 [Magnaporthiopsis poae ATCC 64411]
MNASTRPKAEREAKPPSSLSAQRPTTSGGKATSSASPWKPNPTEATTTSRKAGGGRTSKAPTTTKTPANPGSSGRRQAPPTDLSAMVKQRNGKLSGWRPGVEVGSCDVPRLRLSSSSRSSLSTNWDGPFLNSGNGGCSSSDATRVDESLPGVSVASHQPVSTFFLPWTQDRRGSSSSSSPEPQATDEPAVYEVEATLPAADAADDDASMPDFSRSLGRSDSLFLPARLMTRDPLHIRTDNQAMVTTATGFLPPELLLPVDPALATAGTGTGTGWPVTRPARAAAAAVEVDDRRQPPSVRRQQEQQQQPRGIADLQRRKASSSRRSQAAVAQRPVQHHHHQHPVPEPRVPSSVRLEYARMAAGLQVAAAAGPGTDASTKTRRHPAWHGGDDDDDNDIYDA